MNFWPRSVFVKARWVLSLSKNWIEMLKEQLDASQPMEYSGRNSSEGHAFVCDGYDDNNMFHFNWDGVGITTDISR